MRSCQCNCVQLQTWLPGDPHLQPSTLQPSTLHPSSNERNVLQKASPSKRTHPARNPAPLCLHLRQVVDAALEQYVAVDGLYGSVVALRLCGRVVVPPPESLVQRSSELRWVVPQWLPGGCGATVAVVDVQAQARRVAGMCVARTAFVLVVFGAAALVFHRVRCAHWCVHQTACCMLERVVHPLCCIDSAHACIAVGCSA